MQWDTSSLLEMRSIDAEYQAASGLSERRYYSIFYSRLARSRVMALGFNPGGDPATWSETELASPGFYENGEHEYVDRNYPIALAMRQFLVRVLELPDFEAIRGIPKTNLVFRRSRGVDDLTIGREQAIAEARPFVERILRAVSPELVILEGSETARAFVSCYCGQVERDIGSVAVYTPNGRSQARIFEAMRGEVRALERAVTLIAIGHPSRYANRRHAWAQVEQHAWNAARKALQPGYG